MNGCLSDLPSAGQPAMHEHISNDQRRTSKPNPGPFHIAQRSISMSSMRPDETLPLFLVTFVFGGLLAAFLVARRRQAASRPQPPGPSSYPLIGSWLSLPNHTPWMTYARWSQEYGSDLVSFSAFGQLSVIVNTAKAAQVLLEQRSAIYSDRPTWTIVDLTGWDWFLGFMPYSERWRVRRRIFQKTLREQVCSEYRPLQHKMAENMVKWIYNDSKDFQRYLSLTAAWLTLSLAWGYDAKPQNDPVVEMTEIATAMAVQNVMPGASMLNEVPLLSRLPHWFPGMGYKLRAKECKTLTNKILHGPIKAVKQSLADGTAPVSIASKLLREGGLDFQAEMAIAESVGSVFSAGAETTGGTLHFAVHGLVLNPHVQKRAQEEIDRVVGRDRLPSLDDRPALPYVGAILREAMRWHTVVPLGLPHMTTEDDVYDGYLIPKGTMVFGNIWAITHDPEKYEDPASFKPERFLENDGTLNDQEVPAIFGFGRRVCPGKYIADSSLWMAVASLLAVFDIKFAKDEHGNAIPVKDAVTEGLTSRPQSFECSIVPRDSTAEALIRGLA
ncbi:cytochrome P450 [Dentipellis sp. KUC8613]|nr:cytochrome P450 [Dentipellis sp. KUC8613]